VDGLPFLWVERNALVTTSASTLFAFHRLSHGYTVIRYPCM
jgi:hypothetical protein